MQFKDSPGFTLIEAMIAILLLTVMMLASIMGLVDIKNRGVENTIRQEAVKLGQELVNDIRNEDYAAIGNGQVIQNVTRQVGGFDMVYVVQEDIADVVAGTAKSVIYTISWTSSFNSNAKTYTTRTLVADR